MSAFDLAAGNRRKAAATARLSPQASLEIVPESPAKIYEGDERYTTPETIAWCKDKAGVTKFDLDVAACEESHHADRWIGIEANGLKHEWRGRVWCNPPYSLIAPWVEKAWKEFDDGRAIAIAMLLPASRTEQDWWQKRIEPHRDLPTSPLRIYFLPGRTRFGMPGNPKGVGVGSPPFGCVLLVWRRG